MSMRIWFNQRHQTQALDMRASLRQVHGLTPWPVDPELEDPDDRWAQARVVRYHNCERYGDCLDVAATGSWSSFTCEECPVYDQLDEKIKATLGIEPSQSGLQPDLLDPELVAAGRRGYSRNTTPAWGLGTRDPIRKKTGGRGIEPRKVGFGDRPAPSAPPSRAATENRTRPSRVPSERPSHVDLGGVERQQQISEAWAAQDIERLRDLLRL